MPLGGKSALSQLSLQPLFLIDHNLSHIFAKAFVSVGFNVTSVTDAFPGRRSVDDPEIISLLAQQGRQRAVWITADDDAQKVHAKYIIAKGISVLWVYRPPKTGLTGLQELQLLSLIIGKVATLVSVAHSPIYLKASLNVMKPKLEKLTSSLTSRKLIFKRIPLP